MARFDRCRICDYTEATGSGTIGVNPGEHGKVRRFDADFLCDRCSTEVDRATYSIRPPEEIDEELLEE